MRLLAHIAFLIIILSFTSSCTTKKLAANQIELKGVLQSQGITTYQYGTHTINSNDEVFALKSSNINLDDYLDKTVIIIAEKIEGYPIEGGPNYYEVIKIKE